MYLKALPCRVTSLVELMDGRFDRPLLLLAKTEGPFTATEFAVACDCVPEAAKQRRQKMVSAGLIEVRTIGRQGSVEILEIDLTPLGREVALILHEADARIRRVGERRG